MNGFLKEVMLARWRERIRSRKSIEQRTEVRLQRLIEHARQNVPIYAERLQGITAFNEIPPITKCEMMTRFADTLARNTVTVKEIERLSQDDSLPSKWIRDEYIVSKTSGTTGERAMFVTNRASWDEQRAAVFARTCRGFTPLKRLWGRLWGEKFRIAKIVADCPYCVTRQSALDAQKNGKFMSDILMLSVMDNESGVIEKLNAFQPHFLYLYSSVMAVIARKKLRGTPMTFSPKGIVLSCEFLSDEDRAIIEQAFPQARIINQYGTTECTALGVSCPAGNLHLNIDYVKLEPVDQHHRPVPPGEFSEKILITNLSNTVQPLIRYEVSDSVAILNEPCSCGSVLPVIKLRGRSDDILYLLDQHDQFQEIIPLAVYGELLRCKEIDFYQLLHTQQNELELRIVPSDNVDRALASRASERRLRAVLASRNVDRTTKVNVSILEGIPRSNSSGKFKQTVSLVQRRAG